MLICPFCKKEIQDKVKFCGYCGNPLKIADKSEIKKTYTSLPGSLLGIKLALIVTFLLSALLITVISIYKEW